jgi:hypothetical protein
MSEEISAPEPMEASTRQTILTELRASAAALDPAHAGVYASMGIERWLSAADLATDLLLAHYRYQRRHPGGRRAHSAAVHALLDRTNQAQLVSALAWVNMAFWLLPPRPPGE